MMSTIRLPKLIIKDKASNVVIVASPPSEEENRTISYPWGLL
nr:hypothetical protein [Pectinatus haikarae]